MRPVYFPTPLKVQPGLGKALNIYNTFNIMNEVYKQKINKMLF